MSRDYQDRSPKEQRDALSAYAKTKGYEFVGEYIDEGISGDATEKRLGFQRMIADCSYRRFEIILCWDQDRFGRFDPLEAGYWVKPMRDAGVVLETIAQGRVDWSDFAGRLVWSVTQEGKHAFLRDLARNSLRGNIARAKTGRFAGRAPFGYRTSENGSLELGDEQDVAAVKRVFELRRLCLGYRLIATQMNAESFRSPGGRGWSPDAVRIVLNREAYIGTLVYGRAHRGKYATMNDQVVDKAIVGRNIINKNPIKVPNAHPAIVDLATFEAARRLNREPPRPHANRGNSGAPLAGLLQCGRCESPMYSQSLQRSAGQRNSNYICGGYMLARRCGYCFVQQKRMHRIVRETLLATMISPQHLAAEIKKEMSRGAQKSNSTNLRTKLDRLTKQIDAATERLLTVNQRLMRGLETKLLEMIDERDRLLASVSAEKQNVADPKKLACDLWSAVDSLEKLDPLALRATLRLFVKRIRLNFELGEKTGRGQSFRFTGGQIELIDEETPDIPLIFPD